MKDLVIERLKPHFVLFFKGRECVPYLPGRCPICGCVPLREYTHRISWVAQRVFGFEMLTTCDSHYCRTRDPRAFR